MENSNIRIYQLEDGKTEINVQLDNETVWLNLNQIVELFERDKSVISRHISNSSRRKNCNGIQLLQKMQRLRWMERHIKLITIIRMSKLKITPQTDPLS